jgi:hypothetical protein
VEESGLPGRWRIVQDAIDKSISNPTRTSGGDSSVLQDAA